MSWFNQKQNKAKNTGLAVVVAAAMGGGFQFGSRSDTNLQTLCTATQQLAQCMIEQTTVDFTVIEGYRSQERQNKLYAKGRTEAGNKVTWTLNSRHTSARAFDIVALKESGEQSWDPKYYKEVNKAAEKCSSLTGIGYTWGGTFSGRDWGHFETKQCVVKATEADT
tara:strand:+ start:9193 stop:9690 length:498 start_codon:yes stop_codon:yes gene_type:complete